MLRSSILIAATLATTTLALGAGCAPRPRMCIASNECAAESSCVAGRCQPDKANVKPAIDGARRVVYPPSDMAYVRRGASGPELPSLFALGKDGASLLLRFDVTVPASANVVEAYVVLRRATAVDDDPAPIALHAARITQAWEGRSTVWAFQPSVAERRAPSTSVEPGGPVLVRLDVRELVKQWARRDPADHGIAVLAENDSRTGTTFALSEVAPYLELYLR